MRYRIQPHPQAPSVGIILDRKNVNVFAFGPHYGHYGGRDLQHRIAYTWDDAQATVDWLNDRAVDYRLRSHIMVLP